MENKISLFQRASSHLFHRRTTRGQQCMRVPLDFVQVNRHTVFNDSATIVAPRVQVADGVFIHYSLGFAIFNLAKILARLCQSVSWFVCFFVWLVVCMFVCLSTLFFRSVDINSRRIFIIFGQMVKG